MKEFFENFFILLVTTEVFKSICNINLTLKNMLKINFFIKSGKTNLKGLTPIFAKIILDNNYITLSTGKSIAIERWNSSNKLRNALKLDSEKVLKQSLDLFENKIEKIYLENNKLNADFSLEILKENIKGKKKDETIYLLKIFDKHNEDFKKKVLNSERASASLQKYMRSRDLIELFLKKKYGISDIDVKKNK